MSSALVPLLALLGALLAAANLYELSYAVKGKRPGRGETLPEG